MARLEFNIHDQGDDRIAAFATPEDAARFIGGLDSYSIQYARRVVWREGQESFSASASFDRVAETVYERILTNVSTHP